MHQSTGISSFQIALPLLQAGRVVYDEQVSYRKLDSYMTLKISNPKKRLVGWLVEKSDYDFRLMYGHVVEGNGVRDKQSRDFEMKMRLCYDPARGHKNHKLFQASSFSSSSST